jgi:hypothetical protein
MKKIIWAFIAIALFTMSCQKEMIIATTSSNASIEENGNFWQGWKIANPPSKFDAAGDKITFEDSIGNDASKKLPGKDLVNSGPRIVYAVQSFLVGNLNAIKADLERRGWVIAPLSYLIALNKEYGLYWNSQYWNLYCLDVPVKINFGGGDELAAASAGGNLYNPQTNTSYNLSLRFTAFTSGYSSIYVLAYRK